MQASGRSSFPSEQDAKGMRNRAKIIELNDRLRTIAKGGRVQMTSSVYDLDDRLRGRAPRPMRLLVSREIQRSPRPAKPVLPPRRIIRREHDAWKKDGAGPSCQLHQCIFAPGNRCTFPPALTRIGGKLS